MVGESGMMANCLAGARQFAEVVESRFRTKLGLEAMTEKSREAVRHNDDDTTTTLHILYF